tara:strand:- start:688 stop:876 length:189 start_codon:yes stop_codon:yes gene_type:complete
VYANRLQGGRVMEKKVFARCHFTDDYVQILTYLGNGYYAVRYPNNDTQEAHESSLDFEGRKI